MALHTDDTPGSPGGILMRVLPLPGAPHLVPQLPQTGAAEAFREWADGPWTPPLASVTSRAQGGGKDMGTQLLQI